MSKCMIVLKEYDGECPRKLYCHCSLLYGAEMAFSDSISHQ